MKLNGVDINKIKMVVHDSIPEKYGKMDPTIITKRYEDDGADKNMRLAKKIKQPAKNNKN